MVEHSTEASAAERWTLRLAERAAGLAAAYHRAELEGAERLPTGPALLVGNHGTFGYETPVFFYLLLRETGRYPVGLADRGFFRLPVVRRVLPWLGGIPGTREEAQTALAGGALVVCYPGGAREVFKRKRARYQLQWERTCGFAFVAAQARVPVVPFAGRGIDDVFPVTESLRVRLSHRSDHYLAPVGVPFPLPVRLRFALGQPLPPPRSGASRDELVRFKEKVASSVRRLLRRTTDA